MRARGAVRRGPAAGRLRRAAAIALAIAAGPGTDLAETVPPELRPIPEIRSGSAEPLVLDQLRAARRDAVAVAAGVERGEVEPAAAAASFGRLGQLFAAYELFAPARAAFANARTLAPGELGWHYHAGHAAQEEGALGEAEAAFERSLELDPRYLPALLRLGEVLLLGDRFAEAREAFEHAVQSAPDTAAAHAGLGRTAAAEGRAADAVAHLERALELQPRADRLHYPLALAHRDLGDRESARRHLALRGDTPVTAPDPLVDELASLATGAAFHLVRGDTAMLQGRVADAVEQYRRAVAADPERFAFRKSLAVALYNLHDLGGAERELRRALELEPQGPPARRRKERAEAHFVLGGLLVGLERRAQAEGELRSALALEPGHERARLELANLLGRAGRVEEAIGQLSLLLEHHPDHRVARTKRATASMDLGRFEEARADLERLVREDPLDVATRVRLAASLEGAGDDEAALAAYRRALEVEDGAPGPRGFAHLRIARLHETRGRHGEALSRWESLLEEQPRHRAGHFGLASALVRSGRYREALERLEASLGVLPGDLRLTALLARLLSAAPDPEVHDPRRGLELARGLAARTGRDRHAATLAMALAATGSFEEAAELQREAIRRAEEGGGPDPLPALHSRLERYERGLPWHHAPGEELLPVRSDRPGPRRR